MAGPLDLERRLAELAPDVRTRVELALLITLESELSFAAAAPPGPPSHLRTHSRWVQDTRRSGAVEKAPAK
jgi:hypothetical protein